MARGAITVILTCCLPALKTYLYRSCTHFVFCFSLLKLSYFPLVMSLAPLLRVFSYLFL